MKHNPFHNYSKPWIFLLLIAVMLASCKSRMNIVDSSGMYYLKLGDPLPEPGMKKVKGLAVRDTMIEDGEYEWREVAVTHKGGDVWVEEDFYGSGEVSRIRIEATDVVLKNGLHVGKTVNDLKEISGDWYIVSMPKYKLFDFYSRLFPRIHFVISDSNVEQGKNWEDYLIENFSEEAKVVMIVVY